MFREHLNSRHDSFVNDIAVYCLRQGWWVRWSAQEVAGTQRYTPDLQIAKSRDARCWVEIKVTGHRRVAIEVTELVHQLYLAHPVIVIAKISGDQEVGFHLHTAIPDCVFIPHKATPDDAELALDIATRFGVSFRSIPGRDVRDASNIPFAVYDHHSFGDWKRLLREIVR